MAIANPQTMQAYRLALLNTIPLPPQNLKYTTDELQYTYHIQDLKCSENACLVFNTHKVVKILRPYDDCRYLLKERRNRHKCLLEGLEWNRKFTEDIHFGLARYCDLNLVNQTITLGKILANPKLEDLDPEVEYVLVMNKLPQKYRLDMLLKDSNTGSIHDYESKLTQFLLHIHTSFLFPVVSSQGKGTWGSITQLQNKLKHNFETVEKAVGVDKAIFQTYEYKLLLTTCKALKESVFPIFEHNRYQKYFEERIEKQQIRRCHGDLKARNIWIMPDSGCPESTRWNGVFALDAVDFNPDFCNIDTLSDFAMLVADIHARTNSPELANSIIEDYLRTTKQEDKVSRFVLKYYLVEKAFVEALVSILYDGASKLGMAYLKVTKKYLQEVQLS